MPRFEMGRMIASYAVHLVAKLTKGDFKYPKTFFSRFLWSTLTIKVSGYTNLEYKVSFGIDDYQKKTNKKGRALSALPSSFQG